MSTEDLNEVCLKCISDFEKEGIPFRQSMCNCCPTGLELHQKMLTESVLEQKWGNLNWSFKKGF